MVQYSIPQLCEEGCRIDEKLQQAKSLDHTSLVFEWKFKRPSDGYVFDGEVALRRSMWSGRNVIVSVIRDISGRKKNEEKIRHLAYFDYLTSLHNRVFIVNELMKELDLKRSDRVAGAILFIDLDNFKKINDSYGHFFGDEVLIEFAKRLRRLDEMNLLPSRIGGDEFMVLCNEVDEEGALLSVFLERLTSIS